MYKVIGQAPKEQCLLKLKDDLRIDISTGFHSTWQKNEIPSCINFACICPRTSKYIFLNLPCMKRDQVGQIRHSFSTPLSGRTVKERISPDTWFIIIIFPHQ